MREGSDEFEGEDEEQEPEESVADGKGDFAVQCAKRLYEKVYNEAAVGGHVVIQL